MSGARAWVIAIILFIAVIELGATRRLGALWAFAFGRSGGTKK